MSKLVPAALLACLLLSACTTTMKGDPDGVSRAKDAYFAAWTKKDGEAFTTDRLSNVILTSDEFYSIDGMAPTPTIEGWDTYQKTWQAGMNQFKAAQLVEVSTPRTWNGPGVASTVSECRVTGTLPDGNKIDLPARVTLVYRKVNGQWRVVHENMNVPAQH